MDVHEELRRALARKDPDPGFANRVMARIERDGRVERSWGGWRAVAAALLVTVVMGAWGVHERRERQREGEAAREQVLLALRITSEKVRHVQHEIRAVGAED